MILKLTYIDFNLQIQVYEVFVFVFVFLMEEGLL